MSLRNRSAPKTVRPLDPRPWRRHEASAPQPLTVVQTNDPGGEPSKAVEHRVELQLTRYAGTRARYRVMFAGKTLIASTRDPEFDACRALLAMGIKGTLVTYGPGGSVPRMRIDIEGGAKLMAIDNTAEGPRIGRYRRHPRAGDRDDEE